MLVQRLVKKRREAPRLAYAPWIVVTALFAASALTDERRDATSFLGVLPLAIVIGQVVYPTVLGWAVLWVPATLGTLLLVFWPDESLTASGLLAHVALLLGPAVSVVIFPPRIRRGASQLRFIAASVVAAAFVVIALAILTFNARDLRRPPAAPVRRVDLAPLPSTDQNRRESPTITR